jgi:hypothetical protein
LSKGRGLTRKIYIFSKSKHLVENPKNFIERQKFNQENIKVLLRNKHVLSKGRGLAKTKCKSYQKVEN